MSATYDRRLPTSENVEGVIKDVISLTDDL